MEKRNRNVETLLPYFQAATRKMTCRERTRVKIFLFVVIVFRTNFNTKANLLRSKLFLS